MGIREANKRGLKGLKTLGFVTSAMGGLSIISLLSAGFSIGWAQPLRLVIEQYLVIANTFRHVIEPCIVPIFEMLSDLISIEITFGPRWPDIFLLMLIYLGSRVKSYFASGKPFRAVTMLLIVGVISIVSAFFASAIELSSWQGVLVATSAPLLGFLAYDAVYAHVGATMDRGRSPWLWEFKRHIAFSVPLLIFAFILNAGFASFLVSEGGFTGYQTFVLIFTVDYLVISLYWAYQSLRHAQKRESRNLGESVKERFWRSSATNVALNVGIVLFSAIFFMLGNAGLQAAGMEASLLFPES